MSRCLEKSKSFSKFVLACHLFLLVGVIKCAPPENPIKCSSKGNGNCTITNSLGAFPDGAICKVSKVVYPKTEEEVILAVAMASMKKYKVKAATRYSHSEPKLVCPDESQNGNLLVSTLHLNRVLSINKSALTMTVESGVLLRDFINEAAKVGLALPSCPYWWGLTIGGMISTGAHGSTMWGGSYVHDYVIGLRIVTPASPGEGYAKLRVLENNHPDIKAAKLSLGVLGIISQVTIKLQPLFKRSITIVEKSDLNLATRATTFGKEHEFGDMTWYPYQRKVLYRLDDRVPSNASGNGLNDFIGFQSVLRPAIELKRASEDIQEATGDAYGKCTSARVFESALRISGFGFTNDGNLFTGYPIVGYQNRLQASGSCLDSSLLGDLITACVWDPRIKGTFYQVTSLSLPLSKVKKFIEDVQKLRDLVPQAFCSLELGNGILMRYKKCSDAYLSTQEDSVAFDLTYYRSRSASTPRLYEDVLEEVEQMAVFKYGGIPHWGKNRNVGFIGAIDKFKQHAIEFLKVKESYDPSGVFSSKWTNQILGLDKSGVTIVKNGCALEGLCICSDDIHCAPGKGYVCRPGRIYTNARVCTDISKELIHI
ncbi:hypothetical protein MKW94_029193 [Papaver nudicaule]|uniref:L-gulonolactone oxidase n=1 Tax=Papaver nudicaule TaxID=74823 RepID=A0AA41RX15_PAPNU|nr:hypothetical protein [Papaver nudicaule]